MRLAVLALGVFLAACQSDSGTSPDGGFQEEPDNPVVAEYDLDWGPVAVKPNEESTQCVWLRLSNDSEIKVHQLHNTLGTSSHHLIVYKDDMDQTEQLTPVPCTPFAGALNTTGKIFPMMITQKHDDQLTLPHAVAYTLAAHQMIKIEMHYLNPNEAATQATAKIRFGASDPAAIKDEANILFIGTPDVTVPGNGPTEIHQFFSPYRAQLDMSAAKFFAITGHTHQLGVSVTVGTAEQAGHAVTSVYAPESFLWSEPETTTHKPEFMLDPIGGFDFTCKYYNPTGKTVHFGESANDEMCFFWAYYYPSNGAHVCAHATYQGFPLDLCCPDAGPELCGLLDTTISR
jgi:hypothetical protein